MPGGAPTGPVRSGIASDDDPDLVERARSGDRAALEALLRSHHARLYAVCRRVTGTDEDAADALQDTLMSVVRGLAGFDGRSRFSTWSYRIAVNAAFDEIRRRNRRPDLTLDDLDVVMDDPTDGVADRVDADAALRRLRPGYRAAVVLRDVCGLDYAEIGEILALPPGTVRSRIARGRAALVPLLPGSGVPVSGAAVSGPAVSRAAVSGPAVSRAAVSGPADIVGAR